MMVTFNEALAKARELAEFGVSDDCGEIPRKYVFWIQDSHGRTVPSGDTITVDKETGECKYEYLEREYLAPYAPIRGYKKIELKTNNDKES